MKRKENVEYGAGNVRLFAYLDPDRRPSIYMSLQFEPRQPPGSGPSGTGMEGDWFICYCVLVTCRYGKGLKLNDASARSGPEGLGGLHMGRSHESCHLVVRYGSPTC